MCLKLRLRRSQWHVHVIVIILKWHLLHAIWHVHVIWHAEERRNSYRLFVGIPKERDHMEDLDRLGRIILKWHLLHAVWHLHLIWHAEERRNSYRLFVGKPKERDHMEDLDRHGKIILKWHLEYWWENVDWVLMAQDMDQRQVARNVGSQRGEDCLKGKWTVRLSRGILTNGLIMLDG